MTKQIELVSAPALAAALRVVDRLPEFLAASPLLNLHDVVPMYCIEADTLESEVEAAVQLVSNLVERLRRLPAAYGEWQVFEPGPYFDLTEGQVAHLLTIDERVSTVRVTFFADALLPAFQQLAVDLLVNLAPNWPEVCYQPDVQRAAALGWQRLASVLTAARQRLRDDIGFLASNDAAEERLRWSWLWKAPTALGLLPDLSADLDTIPTLTLTVDFPLPAFRQPGRLRRLRRHRARAAQRGMRRHRRPM